MRVAMISYNAFVHGEENGLKERGGNSVLLLQNETGSKWGLLQVRKRNDDPSWYAQANAIVGPLWMKLVDEMETIDKVVIYVGATGSERVIELAEQHGLVPEKAVFVMCDCGIHAKKEILVAYGYATSQVIECECGGQDAMLQIYDRVLRDGSMPV